MARLRLWPTRAGVESSGPCSPPPTAPPRAPPHLDVLSAPQGRLRERAPCGGPPPHAERGRTPACPGGGGGGARYQGPAPHDPTPCRARLDPPPPQVPLLRHRAAAAVPPRGKGAGVSRPGLPSAGHLLPSGRPWAGWQRRRASAAPARRSRTHPSPAAILGAPSRRCLGAAPPRRQCRAGPPPPGGAQRQAGGARGETRGGGGGAPRTSPRSPSTRTLTPTAAPGPAAAPHPPAHRHVPAAGLSPDL
ncbi:uncharacterized protein LOC134043801 [Cinclus cinclus]|uniref:uncharacterized protein LOC134043801 n=1 Tax=Cinclus cinclus TaxID=127875 RepID=UPI002E10C3EB